MRILVTISDIKRLGIVLDLESGETTTIPVRPEFIDPTVAGRPPCRPFGITWSPDELFIVNNRQLLIFDKKLDFVRTSATRLQINVHQLAYRDDRVWAVSPWTNSMIGVSRSSVVEPVEFNLLTETVGPYIQREARDTEDQHHFNSVLWADGYLYVAAHAFGDRSFINQYDADTFQLTNIYVNAGHSIHGVAFYSGELFWISTKTGEIRSNAGYCHTLSREGFHRGFAMTSRHFIVGTSEYAPRMQRHTGDSWVQVIDRQNGSAITEVHLPDTGGINDLRLLDEYDYAHCLDPVWSAC